MALLQISEPGMSPDPHERRVAIGIDLGTTHSLVAAVRSSQPQALADETGQVLLPSVVRYLPNGEIVVGRAALEAAATDPRNTVISVKRFMGRGLSDIAHVEDLPYTFVEQPGMVKLKTVAGELSPVQISAEILRVLRRRAEASLLNLADERLWGAVITVPAYFDDAQRQATKDAAELAGLSVLRLLNEPTAAALAYGLDHGSEGVYAVYDLGGGTFDISILRMTQGVFEVMATGGDTALGGDDFDRRLFCHVVEKANLPPLSDEQAQALLMACRALKERLSHEASAAIDLEGLSTGDAPQLVVTRAEFEAMSEKLIAKTHIAVKRALRDAGVSYDDIAGVVLVGGSTRMPMVRQAIENWFGRAPLTDLDPDQVVAYGAAVQAHALAGHRANDDDWLLLDVIPLSLGLETMGGLVERIIPRNATLPVARAQDFTTYRDGQTALALHVVQGERDLVTDCRSLARFELRGIPPMAAGAAKIRVTFQVDADGLLAVSAQELGSGVEAAISVKPSYGLGDDEIARMLESAYASADADMRERAVREVLVDAERLVDATTNALATDGDLLSAEHRLEVDAARDELAAMLRQAPSDIQINGLRRAVETLNRVTEAFAAQRMNRSIRRALTGQHVDQLAQATDTTN